MSEPILESVSSFYKDNKRFLFLAALALGVVSLIYLVGDIIGIVICSYFIALLLSPALTFFEKYGLPRALGAVLVMLGVILLILVPVAICLPHILSSFNTLPTMVGGALRSLSERLNIGLENQYLAEVVENLDWQGLAGKAMGIVEGGLSASLGVLNLFMIPVLVFYFLDEMPAVNRYLLGLLPAERKEKVARFIDSSLEHFRVFFKGQVLIGVILAALYVIGLTMAQIPTSVSLGIFAGLLNIVPYLGLVLGLLFAVLVGINAGLPLLQMLLIPLVFAVVQFLEGFVITPKIMGSSIGISPLLVILSILVFGNLFGIFGVLLAIPVAAVLMTVLDLWNESSQLPKSQKDERTWQVSRN